VSNCRGSKEWHVRCTNAAPAISKNWGHHGPVSLGNYYVCLSGDISLYCAACEKTEGHLI